ncbi:Glycosyltransferase (GlcNAc) [Desulfonatronum zhilinae]|nr:Glycosyltransferase (GlcNAc) [Desulfonatronum zhilinae]
MALAEPRIFVSIPAYRDPDCLNTARDLFAKAAHPDRLVLGVCWQFDPEHDPPYLDVGARSGQVRQVLLPARDSRGPCWARSRIQQLWQGEAYYFQVDSHMRFVQGWDELLIETLYACRSPNPVLSTYPLPFTPPGDLAPDGIVEIRPRHFDDQGILHQHSALLAMPGELHPPFPVWLVSAGMLFTFGRVIREVPYDPWLYFLGEEISLAVRLWTHGWDLFNPSRVVAYHNYNQKGGRARHWEDVNRWTEMNKRSIGRLRRLFGLVGGQTSGHPPGDALDDDLGRYGLGVQRSLAEYEAGSGLIFGKRTWHGKDLSRGDAGK